MAGWGFKTSVARPLKFHALMCQILSKTFVFPLKPFPSLLITCKAMLSEVSFSFTLCFLQNM